MRFALGIEYDGTQYYGFQHQIYNRLPTIQQTIEIAISKIADHPVSIIAAGRTDKGVHATGQVIHFDTTASRSMRSWIFGINTYLPKDICIKWIKPVSMDFHARFSAIARVYQYLIFNSPVRSALWHQRAALYYASLDEKKMSQAAQYFIGEQDFSSFKAAECQANTPVRRVDYFTVERRGSFVLLEVRANAFLHHMVRNMVGVLLDIGVGKKPPACVPEILKLRDRTQASITAPAEGLYLTQVVYPERFSILL